MKHRTNVHTEYRVVSTNSGTSPSLSKDEAEYALKTHKDIVAIQTREVVTTIVAGEWE